MTINKKEEYLIYKLADNMKGCVKIDADLFRKLDVKRGLRNEDGTGVLVGLTNIGNVVACAQSRVNSTSEAMRCQTLCTLCCTSSVLDMKR